MTPVLSVPAYTPPDDPKLRALWLRRMFPDHVVDTQCSDGLCQLDFSWPADRDWYVDPLLEDGLRWWDPSTGFFPAKYWPAAVEWMDGHLAREAT